MQILRSSLPSELMKQALQAFLDRLTTRGMTQETITVGLSGGSSLLGFYQALKDAFPLLYTDLRTKIRFVFLDERLVPLDHPDSNYRLLSEALFSELLERKLIIPSQIIAADPDTANPAEEYSVRVPLIDIGLFGAGPDGHIASLFPNHRGLQDESSGYIVVHNSPKPPSDRISVSRKFVRNIPSAFIFFIGEGKREAYTRLLNPRIPPAECPAKYVLECGSCTVVTDLE